MESCTYIGSQNPPHIVLLLWPKKDRVPCHLRKVCKFDPEISPTWAKNGACVLNMVKNEPKKPYNGQKRAKIDDKWLKIVLSDQKYLLFCRIYFSSGMTIWCNTIVGIGVSGESVTKPKSRKVLRQGHAFPARNFSDCPSRARGREENITFVQPLPLLRISFDRNFDHHQRPKIKRDK